MNKQEAADIVATVRTASPEYDTAESDDRLALIIDYLKAVRGQREITAMVNADAILKLAPVEEPDPLADLPTVLTPVEEPDPLADPPATTRDWAYEKEDEPDPLEDPLPPPPTTSKAGKAMERIASGSGLKRRIRDGDGRLKKGIEVPGLLDTWLKAANLSDSEAAYILGISERMTIYNMRKYKQRQVLTTAQLKAVRADVTSRQAGFRNILALLKQYET